MPLAERQVQRRGLRRVLTSRQAESAATFVMRLLPKMMETEPNKKTKNHLQNNKTSTKTKSFFKAERKVGFQILYTLLTRLNKL